MRRALSFEGHLEDQLTPMYRYALRLTREPSRAEDLVHDTVERALRFRDQFEEGSHFKAWIFTILYRIFVQQYRQRQRQQELLHQNRAETQSPEAIETKAIEHIDAQSVMEGLDALNEEYREAMVLCDLEEMSYKDAADVLGVPTGTIMSRLHRGRKKLRQWFSDREKAADSKAAVIPLGHYQQRVRH